MAIPWAAQQQDAESIQELADHSLPLAVIGMGMSLLHLHRQLVLALWDSTTAAAPADAPPAALDVEIEPG